MMIMTRQTPTSITMALLLWLLLLTSAPPIAAATPLTTTNYRLQSSAYSLTLETSFELKQQNCVTNFGTGAALLDMKFAKSDFTNVDDFNEALTGIFFKSTTAAFFVAYDGRDTPLENDGSNNRYAVITRQNERTDVTPVDEFGNAKVVQYHGEAQILCAVPVKNYDPKKEYVPKEEADKQKWFSSNNPFTMMRVSILVLVVGIGVVVRQRYSLGGALGGIGMMASPTSFFEKAYYNVLDSTSSMTTHNPSRRHYHAPTDSDLGTGLTQGCELSYNPAVQGVV